VKREGFTCDGECGATLVVDPVDTITRHGWYHVFGPGSVGALSCCSSACVVEALRLRRAHVVDDGPARVATRPECSYTL
jgi:hypothetical protein